MRHVSLDQAADAILDFADRLVPAVGTAALSGLVAAVAVEEARLMPVDTGRARASVRASAGDPAVLAQLGPEGPYPPPAVEDVTGGLEGLAFGQPASISDDAANPRTGFVYAWRVGVEGYSDQAPEGAAGPAVDYGAEQWPAIAERAIARAGEPGE